MIYSSTMLINQMSNYTNPYAAIRKKVQRGDLIPIRHGVYETNPDIPGHCLALIIYGPSYLSFDFALSYYDLIPEAVLRYTCATNSKHKKKEFTNTFGTYSYRDVPSSAYPWGLLWKIENGYPYMIATPEKAICDKLYTVQSIHNQKEMQQLLFTDLRIDEHTFFKLDFGKIMNIASYYKTTNHRILCSYLQKEIKHGRNY